MNQMKQTLMRYIRADVPVLLMGPPGVGKTSTILALGKEMGVPVETLIAAIHEPMDFGGWPAVVEGQFKIETPPWVDRLKRSPEEQELIDTVKEKVSRLENSSRGRITGILFFDELTNAPRAVQSALLRVVLERVVGEEKLPDSIYIISAANPVGQAADGWTLSLPLANRMAHIEYRLDARSWADNFTTYWGDPPSPGDIDESQWLIARSMVAAFIHRRPDLLLQVPRSNEEERLAWPSPRSWDFASRLISLDIQGGANSWADDVVSCVGEGAGLEFINWARSMDLVDPEDILRNPHKAPVPDRPDQQFAVVNALCAAVQSQTTPDRWRAAVEYLDRVADVAEDIAALGASHLGNMMNRLYKVDPNINFPDTLVDKIGELFRRVGVIAGGRR
jgi:hypothetical protein